MIPIEVENRIATYFFHRFLPEEVMDQIVELLLPLCLEADKEEDLDRDDLVRQACYNYRSPVRRKEF